MKRLCVSFFILILLVPCQLICMDSEEDTTINQNKNLQTKKRLQNKRKSVPNEEQTEEKGQDEIQKKVEMKKKLKEKEEVKETEIELKPGKGSNKTGGGAGGHFWKIFCYGETVGKVYINLIDEVPIGKHPSLQIYLNKRSQNKGIGKVAYRLACEASQYDTIYAHMSKKNKQALY